ncbi:hypothetical protein [Psychromonas sp.]|uniref:hypothetical protein n=1 Tax=Psychromonas sp. TaxID=1884585 RepID=UPI003A972A5D
MKFSFVRKIGITLFSIFCMLTSSIAFSLPVSTMDMTLMSAATKNVHCDMQTMDHSLMVKSNNLHHTNVMNDCINSSDDIKDCCSESCAAVNCMATPSLITPTHNDLLSAQSTALLFPTSINSTINSPSSSLYRPPIL